MTTTTPGFALQADPADGPSWTDLARTAETLGFETVCVADHPGDTASPFVALAALAGVTSTIGLGTAVLNIGTWEPLSLASEVATLDRLSGHRVLLGVGAGHTPSEWTALGRAYPTAPERVDHLVRVVDAARALLRGEEVTMRSRPVRLDGASLRWRAEDRREVPLLVGGNGRGVLRYGAEVADVIELTGLGRTLADGHLHEPAWSPAALDQRVALIDAARRGRPVRLGALVQRVVATDERVDALSAFRDDLVALLGPDLAPSLPDLLETPYVLVGTPDEIVAQLRRHADRWGITRYTVRVDAIDALAPVIDRLRDPALWWS